MPLLTLNFSCENVKYPARKHFAKTNSRKIEYGPVYCCYFTAYNTSYSDDVSVCTGLTLPWRYLVAEHK